MIVAVTRPVRPYADLADLTAKEIIDRGWQTVDGDEVYVVQYAVNLSAAEEAAVRRRLTTSGQVEEDLHARAVGAYSDLQAFENHRDLEAFENAAAPTNAQRDAVLRLVIAVVKLLCKVARALIRLQLRRLDSVD
jgi:hypothetical protein